MNTKEELVNFLLSVEPEFKKRHEDHVKYLDTGTTIHSEMIEFSCFVESRLRAGSYQNAANIFNAIEWLLADGSVHENIKNAACVSFLESLLNHISSGTTSLESFAEFLGTHSRACCRSWALVTGNETLDLWNGKSVRRLYRRSFYRSTRRKRKKYIHRIEKEEVMPLLLAACPSCRDEFEAYVSELYSPGEERLPYTDAGFFAGYVIDLYEKGQTTEFPAIFDVIDRLLLEGVHFVKGVAAVGFLEGFQNLAGHHHLDEKLFFPFLKPETLRWWHKLNDFWAGKGPLDEEE